MVRDVRGRFVVIERVWGAKLIVRTLSDNGQMVHEQGAVSRDLQLVLQLGGTYRNIVV